VRQNFCKEVVGWKTLRHPNVLPLLGVTTTNDRLVMVSEWMTNGNITEFLKKNPDVDRLELVRLFLFHSRSLSLVVVDNHVFTVVERRH